MKQCTRCKVEKAPDQYWFDKRLQRHLAECVACHKIRGQKYRLANEGRLCAKKRDWHHRNADKVKAAHQRWNARNPGAAAQRTAIWRLKNLERAHAAQRACNKKLKDAAYAACGGYVCKCCGETEEPFLSLDHINNDGAEHRKSVPHRSLYKWLQRRNYPAGFQVLCMNCNWGKSRNGGVCPHLTQHVEDKP